MRAERELLREYRVELANARQMGADDLVAYYDSIVRELDELIVHEDLSALCVREVRTPSSPQRSSRSSYCNAFCVSCRIVHAFPAHANCRPLYGRRA